MKRTPDLRESRFYISKQLLGNRALGPISITIFSYTLAACLVVR